jgi:hypothetical protein
MVAKNFPTSILSWPGKAIGTAYNTSLSLVQTVLTGNSGLLGGFLEAIKLKGSATADELSPENEEALYQLYSDNTEMPPGQVGESGVDKFETYLSARSTAGQGLIGKLGTTANQASTDAVAASLNTALGLDAKTKRVHTDFKALKQYIQDSDANKPGVNKYKPSALANRLQQLHSQATAQLAKQRDADKARIEKLFQNDPDANFVTNVKAAMGLPATAPDSAVEQTKQSMLAAIDETHTKALESFDKDMNDAIKKMHTAAQQANDLYFFTMLIYNHSDAAQRKKILELCKMDAGPLEIGQGKLRPLHELRGVDLSKLGTLKTPSGVDIIFAPDGSMTIKIPSGMRPWHQNPDNLTIATLEIAARQMKSSGSDTISFDINQGDTEDASWRMEIARAAYAAARKQGFPDDKIIIRVNGEEMKASKLFAANPEKKLGDASKRLATINKQATQYAEKREQASKQRETYATNSMKAELRKYRTDIEQAEAAAAARAGAAHAAPP